MNVTDNSILKLEKGFYIIRVSLPRDLLREARRARAETPGSAEAGRTIQHDGLRGLPDEQVLALDRRGAVS